MQSDFYQYSLTMLEERYTLLDELLNNKTNDLILKVSKLEESLKISKNKEKALEVSNKDNISSLNQLKEDQKIKSGEISELNQKNAKLKIMLGNLLKKIVIIK